MLRIASLAVFDYWRGLALPTAGRPCGHCGKGQRERCQKGELWADCPKIPVSLNALVGIDGGSVELWETLADDKALDLDAWVDARIFLTGCPRRLVEIARKRASGIALDHQERTYLNHWQSRKAQKALF